MNKYITQLGELTWSKAALLGALLGILYYLTMFDDGTSLKEQQEALNQRLSEMQVSLVNTKKAVEDADRFEKDVKVLAQKFENIVNFMPETMNSSEISGIVTTQAQAAGANVKKIEPKSSEEKVDFVSVTRVSLTLEGSYAQIVSFLSYLSRVQKLLIFEKSELAQIGGDLERPRLSFSATLMGYRYIGEKEDSKSAASGGGVNATK